MSGGGAGRRGPRVVVSANAIGIVGRSGRAHSGDVAIVGPGIRRVVEAGRRGRPGNHAYSRISRFNRPIGRRKHVVYIRGWIDLSRRPFKIDILLIPYLNGIRPLGRQRTHKLGEGREIDAIRRRVRLPPGYRYEDLEAAVFRVLDQRG